MLLKLLKLDRIGGWANRLDQPGLPSIHALSVRLNVGVWYLTLRTIVACLNLN